MCLSQLVPLGYANDILATQCSWYVSLFNEY
jgi:hypothetical protein